MNKNNNLGKEARDKITGFSGVITGHAEYLTGCDQYCLLPKCKDDGSYNEGRWFDEGRIEILDAKVEKEDVKGKKNGCDHVAPVK